MEMFDLLALKKRKRKVLEGDALEESEVVSEKEIDLDIFVDTTDQEDLFNDKQLN